MTEIIAIHLWVAVPKYVIEATDLQDLYFDALMRAHAPHASVDDRYLTWPHLNVRKTAASVKKVTLYAEMIKSMGVFATANSGGLSGNRSLGMESPTLENSED